MADKRDGVAKDLAARNAQLDAWTNNITTKLAHTQALAEAQAGHVQELDAQRKELEAIRNEIEAELDEIREDKDNLMGLMRDLYPHLKLVVEAYSKESGNEAERSAFIIQANLQRLFNYFTDND